MKTAVREQRIISILESRGEMSVNELGAILNISVSTLRKQLADMQEKKLIIRTYGGVMSINPVPDETFDSKLHKNVNEKRRIATKARSLIKSGDSLSLGSGTTVYALSNLLDDLSSAEIYTNSMQAAEYLANWAILNTHICGGIIRSATGTIIGSEAYNFFNNIDVDYAFISCDAVDDNGIVYSDNLAVATVERAVLRNARKKYVLCDSTKFGKSSVASIADLADCEAVITGTEAKSVTENLKFRGINIIFSSADGSRTTIGFDGQISAHVVQKLFAEKKSIPAKLRSICQSCFSMDFRLYFGAVGLCARQGEKRRKAPKGHTDRR